MASEEPMSEPWLRIFGSVSYAVLCTLSILFNVILARVLIKNHRHFKKTAFFVITWQLLFCEVLTQSAILIVGVPMTASGMQLFGSGFLLHALSSIDSIAYYATISFSFLMTLNRATVFFLENTNKKLFEGKRIYAVVICTWAFALSAPLSLNFSECYKSFSPDGVYDYSDCVLPTARSVLGFWKTIKTFCPILMLTIYVAIFVYLRYLVKTSTPLRHQDSINARALNFRRREQRLLLQSFIICGSLEMENLAFNFLGPLHMEGDWKYLLCYLQTWIKILNSTMTAMVLFFFNTDIRSRIFDALSQSRRSSLHVATVSMVPSHVDIEEPMGHARPLSSRF